MKKIIDCIAMEFDYPHEEIMENGMRDDCVYGYVSHTFCNGIVNWLDNVEMYMLCRYNFGDKNIDYIGCTYTKDDITGNPDYKEFLDTIDAINNVPSQEWVNTDFGRFDFRTDDIIVTGETCKSYWAIWFDNDVSDCFIYKISKDNYQTLPEFNDAFVKHIQDSGTYIAKVRKPNGWMKIM